MSETARRALGRAPAWASRIDATSVLPLVAVALVAFAARLAVMVRGGGLSGSDGYDDSVYYAAATALIHGRLPYRDFVLLHPPGLLLALAPFAALAQLVSDRTGQELARLAFMALGALNAVLVMRVGRHFSPAAGLVAGVIYAVSYPALYSERTTTLEALGNTTVLVALTLLTQPAPQWGVPRRWTRRLLVGAGVALGLGATVKIWGVVALTVFIIWVAWSAGPRAAAWLAGAAGATVVAVCLPFYLAAPSAMWRMVVLDQLGRPRSTSTWSSRLSTMVGLKEWLPHPPHLVAQVAVTAVLLLLVTAMVTAARVPGARVVVVLLTVHIGVLLASPNLYLHYASLVWAPGAVVLGLAAGQVWTGLRSRGSVVAAWVCLVAVLGSAAIYGAPGILRGKGKHLDPALAVAASGVPGCITADDPTYLIAMNVLSRNFRAGCPVWIDPTGMAIDRAGGADEKSYASTKNPVWQESVMGYLMSGDATMVARAATQLDRASSAQIRALPVIIETTNGFALRQVR
jgi:alpha-1,2-mannosyltransferase